MNQNRFRRSNSKKQFAEINVVPYVDVTLVLLIIFMVTAPIVARSMLDSTMQFYIQGDTRAPYGKVVKLFTLLKVNGVEKVSLMTQPEGDA
jgi:biopolymer transport protein TolR